MQYYYWLNVQTRQLVEIVGHRGDDGEVEDGEAETAIARVAN